ncbi:MAG: 8-amino-7-oxononanoate synthase [Pyrinomonadaceae bacterium]|nr:8-amino-7-oxononanoate synthase [Pyrinomonadaceae bacterium]
MKLAERIRQQLKEIEAKGLTRKLSPPRGIDFSSNDFLCLANDSRIKNAFVYSARKDGIGSTASRLLRGDRDLFHEAEARFADWKTTEGSLYFATGYQANVGILQTFLEPEDVVFSDELNHASLIDGIRLSKCKKVVFPHLDPEHLSKLLRETSCRGQKFLVTESLFSMDGDIAPLDKYAELCRETNTNLIVDEAHAVGIFGKRGSGLIEEFGIEQDVFLSVNTAGKALGVSGAFAAGDTETIEYLINRCRSFIFSTAPVPAAAAALIESIGIAETEDGRRKKLLETAGFFRRLLNDAGITVPNDNSQIVPIMIGGSERAVKIAESMQAKGFDVRAIRPPTVAEGTSRLRVSLNSGLTENVLREFVDALEISMSEN